jgi:hypothetical protein
MPKTEKKGEEFMRLFQKKYRFLNVFIQCLPLATIGDILSYS